MKVLIVEYGKLFRQCLEYRLKKDNIECVGSTNHAEEAIKLAQSFAPDIALVGTLICGMGRIELIKRLRSKSQKTGILLITSSKERIIVEAIQAGADGVMPEDLTYEELVQAMHSLHLKEAVFHVSGLRTIQDRLAQLNGETEIDSLNERELQLVRLISRGLSTKEVAHEMSLSERTVSAYLTKIFTKLNVESRLDAILKCLARGWLNAEELYKE